MSLDPDLPDLSSARARPRNATIGALIGVPASIYLAAAYLGPAAAALASGLGVVVAGVAHGRHSKRMHQAILDQTRLARLDDLTGLGNGRGFREELNGRMADNGSHVTLALVDVDQFKSYNDQFGHLAGDEALREVGRLLAQGSESPSRVYRIGGDEFAILFVDPESLDALEAAGEIRRSIAEHAWPLRPVTVSLGLSKIYGDGFYGEGGSSLIERADRRLYQAKREGGDRLIPYRAKNTPSG